MNTQWKSFFLLLLLVGQGFAQTA
jgi:heat shock protein beta